MFNLRQIHQLRRPKSLFILFSLDYAHCYVNVVYCLITSGATVKVYVVEAGRFLTV